LSLCGLLFCPSAATFWDWPPDRFETVPCFFTIIFATRNSFLTLLFHVEDKSICWDQPDHASFLSTGVLGTAYSSRPRFLSTLHEGQPQFSHIPAPFDAFSFAVISPGGIIFLSSFFSSLIRDLAELPVPGPQMASEMLPCRGFRPPRGRLSVFPTRAFSIPPSSLSSFFCLLAVRTYSSSITAQRRPFSLRLLDHGTSSPDTYIFRRF